MSDDFHLDISISSKEVMNVFAVRTSVLFCHSLQINAKMVYQPTDKTENTRPCYFNVASYKNKTLAFVNGSTYLLQCWFPRLEFQIRGKNSNKRHRYEQVNHKGLSVSNRGHL